MAFKQCDKCGKWYEPKDDNALCEDCVNNQHHETYNLSSVLTNEQAVTIKKRNNFFWWFIVAGMLLSASSYLVYFLPQQKIWWLIGFFCVIDLVHLFVTCFNIFCEDNHRIIKSIGGIIAYVLALFIIFVIFMIFVAGVTDGLQLAFDLKVDAVFCIIFSAPVAVIVCCLLALIREGM